MATDDKPPSLDELDARVKAAQEARRRQVRPAGGGSRGDAGGIGVGMRVVVELVAGVVVGTGLGLALDRWLGTEPWLLVVGLLLGFTAGILNVYRVAQADDARRKAEALAGSDQSRPS